MANLHTLYVKWFDVYQDDTLIETGLLFEEANQLADKLTISNEQSIVEVKAVLE